MTSLLNLRPSARALACLWLTSALPVPVILVLVVAFVTAMFCVLAFVGVWLVRGGPVWDRLHQLISTLLPCRKQGG